MIWVEKDYPIYSEESVEWSNPSKTINDNPRIFFKSILKPLKGWRLHLNIHLIKIYMIIIGIPEVCPILLYKEVKM